MNENQGEGDGEGDGEGEGDGDEEFELQVCLELSGADGLTGNEIWVTLTTEDYDATG